MSWERRVGGQVSEGQETDVSAGQAGSKLTAEVAGEKT